MSDFLTDWFRAMPTTIIGLLLTAVAVLAMGFGVVVTDASIEWLVATLIVGQVGTALALLVGLVADSRRTR